MTDQFSNPYMYWVGMTVDGAGADEMREFHRHYNVVHSREVLGGNPGFVAVHRYELIEPDPRGIAAPQWLAVYEVADRAAAEAYISRRNGTAPGKPVFTPGPPVWTDKMKIVWRMMWKRMVAEGNTNALPHVVRMIGMDPAPGTDVTGLAEFNRYYSDVHLREVLGTVPFDSAVRYEVMAELAPLPDSTPRYCAIYEAEESKIEAMDAAYAAIAKSPPVREPAPPSWVNRNTAWRLTYQRVPMENGRND
jgi:hypothetical protein